VWQTRSVVVQRVELVLREGADETTLERAELRVSFRRAWTCDRQRNDGMESGEKRRLRGGEPRPVRLPPPLDLGPPIAFCSAFIPLNSSCFSNRLLPQKRSSCPPLARRSQRSRFRRASPSTLSTIQQLTQFSN
jgi:hypothetical protein